jgi:hypothetical protein
VSDTGGIDKSCFATLGVRLDRWCIWSKHGRRPCYWHPTQEGAEREARRLAGKFPKQKFIVLHAVSKFGTEPATKPEADNG